ncbi:MAG: hypothetical protein O3A14_19065, partial [Cyanobacteria bacterium]|nr:hypothetical protein [Cyanobacteriota bacterium]
SHHGAATRVAILTPNNFSNILLEAVVLPRTGRYYVAVTTYNNDPILNERGTIIGWTQTGGSAVEYTLTISGATPTQELILTHYGPETLAPE